MKPHLYFHLSFWGTIALVLFFSSPSQAAQSYWVENYTGNSAPTASGAAALAGNELNRDGVLSDPGDSATTSIGFTLFCNYDDSRGRTACGSDTVSLHCSDGSRPVYGEYTGSGAQTYCTMDDPPPPPVADEGVETQCGGEGATPQTACIDGSRYTVGSSLGLMIESGSQWGGTCVSTGDACTGEESQLNPDYDLDVLPKTDQSVEINGTEYPLVESGCGEVAGSLVCTNDPGCGEFNGDWICTGPDNGTEGVPASPTLEYTASGNTSADRAGDQYYYDSNTVTNSTNLGTGGTSDPTDDGKADTPTDGSDSGDPNAPLGQGSCPTGYVQQGVTALPDGSTEANCVRAGDEVDWMGLADKLDMSDELPSGWLDAPEIPGFGGPSSSCPQPSQFSIAGATIDIPFQPVCDLASMLRPFLIMIGYLIAGWFVFRIVGNNN